MAALACASFALTACGGSSNGSISPTTSPKAAAPLTKMQATAVADRVNLAAADLPGYVVKRNVPTAKDKAADAASTTCIGGTPDSEAFIDANSSFFSHSGLQVSSEFEVEPSAEDVQHDLVVVRRARARQCIEASVRQELSGLGATAPTITFHPIAVSSAGTSGSFGLTVSASFTHSGQTARISETEVGLARGNVELSLDVADLTSSHVPAALITRLRGVLVARADQNVPAQGLTTT
jgi:hypothetical protein